MYRIFSCPIDTDECPKSARRDRERAAEATLLAEAFGEGATLGHEADGAPFVEGHPEAEISISHCKDLCVLVVDCEPIGVDVEDYRSQLRRVASRFVAPCEGNPEELTDTQLLKLWTAKEAIYKVARTPGLGLQEIEVDTESGLGKARGATYRLTFQPLREARMLAVAQRVSAE